MERAALTLGRGRATVHLTGGRLIEPARQRHLTDGFEEPEVPIATTSAV
jgi:hypothetical protein